MSSLKYTDRIRLEKFLEMSGGYVCDFSDRTFRDFIMEATGIDVYSVGYEDGGTSKANRLRTFWKKEDDLVIANLLKEIIEYQKVRKQTSGKELAVTDEVLYKECTAIAAKLLGSNLVMDEIDKGILEILNDPKYPQGKRSFSLFKKRYFGAKDDDIRMRLRNLGAQSFRDKQDNELWGLRTSVENEYTTDQSNQQTTTSRQIVGAYVMRDEIIRILLSKGYPEESLHSAWKQGQEEYDLVVIDPATEEILVVFLFELYDPNPIVVSSKTIREVIRKFATLVIGSKTQLYYITAMNGQFSFSITKILSQTKNSDLPIFVNTKDLPEYKMFKSTHGAAAMERETELKHKSMSVNKSINEFTDEELLVVIRRAENTNVPGSQYQKAYNEWQIRHQQKMLEATKKEPQPAATPFQVSGDYIAGDKVGRDKNINKTKLMKDSLPSWLQYAGVFATIFAFLWGLYIYFNPSSSVVMSPSAASTSTPLDLRNMLIGSIFDLVQEIQKIDKELLKEDLLQNSKGRIFEAEGAVSEIGKFESGEIWVTIHGAATDGSFEAVECHFDDSWEKTLRSMLSTNKEEIKFSGEIGYYKQGWLIAEKCKILEVKN